MLPRVCVFESSRRRELIRVEVAQQYRCPINRYKLYTHTHRRTPIHQYINIYIYMCVRLFALFWPFSIFVLTAIMQSALELRSRGPSSRPPRCPRTRCSTALACSRQSGEISGNRIAPVPPILACLHSLSATLPTACALCKRRVTPHSICSSWHLIGQPNRAAEATV